MSLRINSPNQHEKFTCCNCLRKNSFHGRGGRNLDVAKASVQKAVNRVRQPKLKHSRPNQFGNPMFRYISSRRRCGDQRSQESIIAEWKRLPPNEKLLWRARQRVQCQMQREQNSNAAQWGMRQQEETQVSTAWNLGNSDYPIAPELIADYLKTFETKGAGLPKLRQVGDPQVQQYVESVERGEQKYHSLHACRLLCKTEVGVTISQEMIDENDQITQIMGGTFLPQGCCSKHPGLCAKEGLNTTEVNKFLSLFPKKSCMLRLELKAGRGSNIVYLRCIEGPRKFFLFFQHRWLMGMPHHSISKMWGQQFFRKIHSTVYWIHERCL